MEEEEDILHEDLLDTEGILEHFEQNTLNGEEANDVEDEDEEDGRRGSRKEEEEAEEGSSFFNKKPKKSILDTSSEYDSESLRSTSSSSSSSSSSRDDPSQTTRKRIAVIVGIISALVMIGLIVGMISAAPEEDNSNATIVKNWRLPNNTIPSAYSLFLSVGLASKNWNYDGKVDITFQLINRTTDTIIINAIILEFKQVTIKSLEDDTLGTIQAKNVSYDEDLELAYIQFPNTLPLGEYIISIAFIGYVNDELFGFYRSSFTDSKGNVHRIGVTQFEATSARQAFPCFDEPQLKAKFKITIEADAGGSWTVLSNMPGTAVVKQKRQTVTFEETLPMSTYLVAWAVGEFDRVQSVDSKGRPVSVWTVQGKAQQGVVALNFTVKVVGEMESYFDIIYPLPKWDLIAIPDYEGGAMENWGLITFAEEDLLLPSKPTQSDLTVVAGTVSHELVHQWTGDLVTCAWWSDLWLNEGFAQFYEPYFVNVINPTWNETDEYIIFQSLGMADDALPTIHPIVLDVNSSEVSVEIFDDITYNKGASLNFMMSTYLNTKTGNPNTWRNAIRSYLKQYKYQNVLSYDLFYAIGQSVDMPSFPELMYNWTNTPGFPVVSFEAVSGKSNTYQVSQKRYFDTGDSSSNQTWWIPLTVMLDNGTPLKISPLQGTETQTIKIPSENGWFKANSGQFGYYRVNYPTNVWTQLAFAYPTLHKYDRAGLISDALHFACSNLLPTPTVLGFLKTALVVGSETEYISWSTVWDPLYQLSNLLDDQTCFSSFNTYLQGLVSNIYSITGWRGSPTESHATGLLRESVLTAAVDFGLPAAWNDAQLFLEGCTPKGANCLLSPDARLAYYSAIVQWKVDGFELVLDWYKQEKDASEIERLLAALTYTTERYQVQFLLNQSLNKTFVRPQYRSTLIVGLAGNSIAREQVWSFMKSNWKVLNSHAADMLEVLTYFSGEFWYKEFKSFFEVNPPNSASNTLQNNLQIVLANGRWVQAQANSVCNWLSSPSTSFAS